MKQLPLYEQVHKMILKQIDTGEYPPGGRLPSEKELEKLYHVSRITAQKAMNLLAEDGRIVRLQGIVCNRQCRGYIQRIGRETALNWVDIG